MTGKEFLNSVAHGKSDIIQTFLDIVAETNARYCMIGGLAVNAYVEPVVSLDLDIIAAVESIDAICESAARRGMRIERFEHSVNLSVESSDLRIQLQTDSRYQEFLSGAEERDVLGYRMMVAGLEDVMQGKVWAYMDSQRRRSKRQKDLADILRIVETYPALEAALPPALRKKLSE
ncbi:MAG: hypothetical protein HY770_00160 [Chitinivibrionia bacterium]|nr:hypothetical protein [Chitinivibrionia bacterium]